MKIGTRGQLLLVSFALILLSALAVNGLFRTYPLATALFWTLLLAVGAAVVATGLHLRIIAAAVAEIAADAKRVAEGDFGPSPHSSSEDFGELARALDRLAKSWSKTVLELRDERDRLRTIMAGMQEGLLLLDHEGRIELVNSALREMLLVGSDAVGKTPLEVVRHAELKDLFDAVRTSREPGLMEVELGGLKPRRLLVRATVVGAEQEEILAVFVDVTEMRRLESMRRDFVANVSHELRTPITAVRSAAETLQAAIPDDPQVLKKFIGIIERNAERLHVLVEDLLDLSRIESREYRLNREPVELRALVAQVLGLFRDRIEKKAMEVLNEASTVSALGDRKAIEHVVANLIDNAVKYSGQGSRVRIFTESSGQGVRLVVEDNGPGIEAKHLPRLFERFYRVDAGRSREVGGTGLGLSIVKHLTEAMSGRVSVESTPGAGARFVIALERADAASEAPPQSGKHPRAVA